MVVCEVITSIVTADGVITSVVVDGGVMTTDACLWPNGGMSKVVAVKCAKVGNWGGVKNVDPPVAASLPTSDKVLSSSKLAPLL